MSRSRNNRKALERMSKDRAYHYHVTVERWGTQRRLLPLPDDHPKIVGRGSGEEPDVERICVAPSPAHCLASIYWYVDRDRTFNVYRTARPVMSVKPWDVSDSNITRERWLIRPTMFVKVGTIPVSILDSISLNSPKNANRHRSVLRDIQEAIKELNLNC